MNAGCPHERVLRGAPFARRASTTASCLLPNRLAVDVPCRNQKEHVIPNGVRAVRNPSCL